MTHRFAMRRSVLVQVLIIVPMVLIILALALTGHFAGGIEGQSDNELTSTLIAVLVLVAASLFSLFMLNQVRYEVSGQGVAIFVGPFRLGIHWKAVRDIKFYRLPMAKQPYGVAVHFRQRGLTRRKILMPENVQALHEVLQQQWQHYQQEQKQ